MVVHGWQLLAHPIFVDQVERMAASVSKERRRRPDSYRSTSNAKLVIALKSLVFDTIPQDPARAIYRQGATLGDGRKHWFGRSSAVSVFASSFALAPRRRSSCSPG